jgi:diguanylate cyclase (GGDEF)-like protein
MEGRHPGRSHDELRANPLLFARRAHAIALGGATTVVAAIVVLGDLDAIWLIVGPVVVVFLDVVLFGLGESVRSPKLFLRLRRLVPRRLALPQRGPIGGSERAADDVSSRDTETGLPPTATLMDRIAEWTTIAARYRAPFALVLLRVDFHPESDAEATRGISMDVVDAISETIRDADTLAQISDNEFGLVLPNQDADRAFVLGARLARALAQVSVAEGQPIPIAIGIASAPRHADDSESLWRAAVRALKYASASREGVAIAPDRRFGTRSEETRPLGDRSQSEEPQEHPEE